MYHGQKLPKVGFWKLAVIELAVRLEVAVKERDIQTDVPMSLFLVTPHPPMGGGGGVTIIL